MDGTDADEEWSDDDMGTTRALTVKSNSNQEDKNFQSYTITLKRPNNSSKQAEVAARMPTLTLDILTGDRAEHAQISGNDPVSLVMDKIDAELEAMSDKDTGLPVGSRLTEKPQRKPPRMDTASQNSLTNMAHPAAGQQQPAEPEIPGDLDQLSPEQIDRKFQEILWKKKGIWSWSSGRPSAAMLSTGYSTDNDSVRTEDFESKFLGMMVSPFEMETPVTKPRDAPDVPFQRTTPRTTPRATPRLESKSPKFKPLPRPIINRPRSLSLNRKRSDKKTVSIHDADEKEKRKELSRSGDIKESEGQAERRARSASPTRSCGESLSLRKSYHGELSQTIENADVELSVYRQTLHVTENKVREAEEELRAARGMAENAKSELMVLEFNRGSASKELERITEEIARRKGQMSALDSEIQLKIEELKSMRTLGVTMEECLGAKTVKDENASLKMKLRNIEGLQLERDELVRQLEVAKEDLFKEQKLGRERLGELQEVIETVTLRLEEAETLRTLDQDQIMKLEAAVKKMEREMNEAVQEKIQGYEERITYCNADKAECERRLQRQVSSLDEDVRGLTAKLNDLQMENQFKDSLVEKLRHEVRDLTSVLETERQDRQNTSSDQKRVLRQLKKETTAAVSKLKESMLQEKQEALNQLKKELEEERLEAGTRSDERLAQLLEEHASLIAEKDGEISRLQDILRTIESDHQVREAVSRERERAELEKDWQLRHEKEEEKRRIGEVIAALDREKLTNRNLILEMTNLKKELDEQRKQQRDSSKDKLIAISRTKDQMKEQGIAEMERVKFNLKQEHETEVDKLKERLNSQEQELSRARSDLQEISERECLLGKAIENSEQLVVKELNKACQRVADMMGGTKKAGHLVDHSESPNGRTSPAFKNRTAANAAVSNLHTCLEELEYNFNELKQGNKALRNVVRTIKKERDAAVDNCQLEMERKRTSDLEKLKEQLLKEHVSEMSNVIRECAEANSQLKTNSQILQRYGDAALLEALQAKDDELRTLQTSMKKWQEDAEDRFNTQLQLQTAKEREKYQALQHHATREQKRISDLQKRDIDRLENELQKLSSSTVHDSNRFVTSSPVQELPHGPEKHPPSSSSPGSMSASKSRSSQQYLQARIQQLQSENAALRKQRMLASGHLSWSTSNLAQAKPKRPMSPTGRSRSPTFDPDVILRLGERIKQGEREILKAEERAKQNRKVMNNKMDEMTRLQNKLFVQNQELQELERSYNDLQKNYHVSHASSAQNLNTTF